MLTINTFYKTSNSIIPFNIYNHAIHDCYRTYVTRTSSAQCRIIYKRPLCLPVTVTRYSNIFSQKILPTNLPTLHPRTDIQNYRQSRVLYRCTESWTITKIVEARILENLLIKLLSVSLTRFSINESTNYLQSWVFFKY